MTTSLVTGGNGYFGHLLVQRLVARGDRVRLLDIDVTGAAGAGVRLIAADIRDAAAVREAVDGVDVVFHNVAQVPLSRDPHLLRTVNVDGTRILLDAAADAGVAKVVHTSSSAVFGVPASNPVLPTTVPKPQEDYGHAKLAAEWSCLRAASEGLDVTIVRPRTILGHGRLGIFGILFDWIADGADPIVLGDGSNRYQFVHADDLAAACLLAGDAGGPAVFNVGTDRFGTMREALANLCAHAGTGAEVRSLPVGPTGLAMRASAALHLTPFAPYHWLMYSKSMWFDIGHVRTALDWTPRWSTDEMFAESYDWFLANRAQTDDAGASHHRRTARAGALGALKRVTGVLPRRDDAAGLMRTLSRRWMTAIAVAVLALLAYVPALASSPNRMPADTKLYLYLDPGRLIGDAPWTFDGRQFAGWVPHQVIAYLWPQGPWYWLGAAAGLPDWLVHRMWIGTLFLAAGTGVLLMSRRLGLTLAAAMAAALVYQLAPYILPYVSRTSAMLLPWAGLGWIVGLTVAAATRARWRYAALTALVVATVGAVNATALLMIAPAPVLWLLTAAGRRVITWRRAALTAALVGGLSLGVSLWWVVMVAIQGRQGADVLAYSESLESVSYTSTSAEVWRGLGYWLTYVRDAYAATTTAGRDYMVSGRLIVTGFVLLIVALTGLVITRWTHRQFAVALVVTGVVLGVGVHPIDDPSPLMDLLLGDGTSGAALALRSSTRAVPMLMLGLALGAGVLVDALGPLRISSRVSWRPVALAGVGLLALANLPVLTGHRLVDAAIDRDESPPAAWLDATRDLDADPDGGRVLQLPGQEFGAFRWGYTVDPPLPGLTDRPLVTRDLLPLGSAAAMDLLYALDDRFQSGTVDPAAIAPVARFLGADTVWLSGDAAFDRFRTARPEVVADLFDGSVPGVGAAVPYGEPVVNQPDIPMVDEQALSDPRIGQPIAPVELVPVTDPQAVIRIKDDVVLVTGSGDGLVDAAAAGLLDGRELVRYTGSLEGRELTDAAASASEIIVTDSNRDRAHQWRSSQDVVGFTEDDDPRAADVLRDDAADERLPVFGAAGAPSTVAVQDGPVQARATAYGEPFAYRPEDRAVMAVDGDPATAWRVADRASPIGEQIRLDIGEPVDHLTLLQPAGAGAVRHIDGVSIAVDDATPFHVDLDERSLTGDGQRIDIEPTDAASSITITIDSVAVPDPTLGPALAAVGFAEIGTGLPPTVEVVRPPSDAATTFADADDTPVSFVLTRLRTRPTDRWRSDPEPTMVREIELPTDRTFVPAVTVRLDQRATDGVLADLLGITGPRASDRLVGAASATGWSAADGDPVTAWTTPFSGAIGSTLDLTTDAELTTLTLTQPGGEHSPIAAIRLTAGSTVLDAVVPAPGAAGTSVVALPGVLPAGPVQLEIMAVDPHVALDRRYAEPVVLPAAISEIDVAARTVVPDRLDTGCRDDLVFVGGTPVPVRIEASVADLLAGEPVEAASCEAGALTLARGRHRLTTTSGTSTGLDVDRVVLADPSRPTGQTAGTGPTPTVAVRAQGRTSRDVTVDGCPDGCWLVLGEGHHDAWSASTAAGDLGPPQLVDGGFNGWWVPPSDGAVEVAIRWTAQTPLTVALVLTIASVLGCLVLIAVDRRHTVPMTFPPARLALAEALVPRRDRLVASAVWVVAAGLLVGPGWALVAAVGAAVLVVALGRPRSVGFVTLAILIVIGVVIADVVRSERPWPDAGWPVRFEWLHSLGLFAAVSLLVTIVVGWRRRPMLSAGPPPSDGPPAPPPTPS